MALLSKLFGRRPEPTPDGLALPGLDLPGPLVLTILSGDRTFTTEAVRRGPGWYRVGELREVVEMPAAAPDSDAAPATDSAAPTDSDSPPATDSAIPADSAPARPFPGDPPQDRDEVVAVVRIPVTDPEGEVEGYELVSPEGAATGPLGTAALLLDAFGDIGLERVTGRHPAWVTLSPAFLAEIGTPPVRPDRVVLQVAAEPVADEALTALRRLRFSGYRLVLTGYDGGEQPLLDICTAVRVPVAGRDDDELRALVAEPAARGLRLVATEVATPDEVERCRGLGFTAFQGDFFAKPGLVSSRRVGTGGVASLNALARVAAPDATFEDLEQAITSDVGLSLKLLRYVNSAFFSLPREVASVREALTLLGTATVRRWAIVVALVTASGAREELVELALQRARMCEVLGGSPNAESADAHFTVGLFSVADALLDASMDDVLAELPFSAEIRAALLTREGPKGKLLNTVEAYERGAFPAADGLAGAYGEALEFAGDAARAAA